MEQVTHLSGPKISTVNVNLCLQKNINVTDSLDLANTILKVVRLANVNHLIYVQLNIKSIRNTFESLKEFVSTKFDILLICETKLDSSFSKVQFHIHGFGEP